MELDFYYFIAKLCFLSRICYTLGCSAIWLTIVCWGIAQKTSKNKFLIVQLVAIYHRSRQRQVCCQQSKPCLKKVLSFLKIFWYHLKTIWIHEVCSNNTLFHYITKVLKVFLDWALFWEHSERYCLSEVYSQERWRIVGFPEREFNGHSAFHFTGFWKIQLYMHIVYILYQSCKYLFLHNSEIIIGDCIELGVYFYYRIAIKKFQV